MHAQGKASLDRIGELLDSKPTVIDRENVEGVDEIRGDIEFRNLDFTYPDGDVKVLSDISFSIKAGENVGIIGRTGSGKTTLVDLILRTYNVPDGTLFIDGRDVNSLPIKQVRAAAAYVPQDNFLFSDTIENNIAFATDNATHEGVEAAAKLSDVHENIVEFAMQYESVLGERGVTVSGGQKQRISIARALMKNAAILILDDSVSAVDVKTEKAILSNLRETRRGKTTILIAHRISTIEQMDKIIFIDNGTILAVGTHAELYSSSPEYRTMVDLQKLDEAEDESKGVKEVSANA
jgi:ATP-binding cassette subfamily B protein